MTRMWKHGLAGLCALFTTWAGSSAPCAAAPVTFDFTGTITQAQVDPDNPFSDDVDFGDPFSGQFTFDSTAADAIAANFVGSYASPAGAPFGLSFTIGADTLATSDFLNIGITNDVFGADVFSLLACEGGASCPNLAFELFLQDLDGTVFANDRLPLDAPPFAAFEIATFTVRGLLNDNQFELIGDLTSMRCIDGCVPTDPTEPPPAAVPEPTSLLLLGSGLIAVSRRLR